MKVVLVSVGNVNYETLDEMKSLVKNLNYEIDRIFVQRKKPRIRYLVGSGKVNEIKNYIVDRGIETVIFENMLTSSQVLALENILHVPVMDKFDLILNVFETRARNKEAKLQIELARLKRKIPYFKVVLSRRVKSEHPGYGGSGEYIIHSTLNGIYKRIKKINIELEKYKMRKDEQTLKRKETGRIVSLAGYTNAGKTTLLNVLAKTNKMVKDEPFTTLSTKTSKIFRDIFINDTIGFLDGLPHELIYAFRATFSDIKNSHLILLVLDVSEQYNTIMRKMHVCEKTLKEIQADNISRIYVLNKYDKINDKTKISHIYSHLSENGNRYVCVSALYNRGIRELKKIIVDSIYLNSPLLCGE